MSDIDDELFALAGGDEDIEEGEASEPTSPRPTSPKTPQPPAAPAASAPGSPTSLGSGAMDQSDSEASEPAPVPVMPAPPKDVAPKSPIQQVWSEENRKPDRRGVTDLSQLEREALLGERAEEASQLNFSAELARRAKQSKGPLTPNDRKRKGSPIEADDSQRKSTRSKPKTNESLEAYKRARERREQPVRHDEPAKSGSDKGSPGSVASHKSSPGHGAPKPDDPAGLAHVETVRAGRSFMYEVCFYPGFSEAMTGTFVRVGTGKDAHNRVVYKMGAIEGFSTGKPYVFPGYDVGNDEAATDQYAVVQYGDSKKDIPFDRLSNGSFRQTEFEAHCAMVLDAKAKLPTRAMLEQKQTDMRNLARRKWNDAEVNDKLELQKKYAHLLRKAPPPKVDEFALRLEAINRANRKSNSDEARAAMVQSRNNELRLRKKHHAARLRDEERQRAEKERIRLGLPAEVKPVEPKIKLPKRERPTGIPTFRQRPTDDEILSANLDLEIDIDI